MLRTFFQLNMRETTLAVSKAKISCRQHAADWIDKRDFMKKLIFESAFFTTQISKFQSRNDRNLLFTFPPLNIPPQKMFRVIMQVMIVAVKEFYTTNPNRQRRSWRIEMKHGERLKVCVCCLQALLASGNSYSLLRASRVYLVFCSWLMMWVFRSQHQFIPKVASWPSCVPVSWMNIWTLEHKWIEIRCFRVFG